MCLYHLQDINKESEKGLFNTNKQKTNTRTYVIRENKELNNY